MTTILTMPAPEMSLERVKELDAKYSVIKTKLIAFIQEEFAAEDFCDTLTGAAVLADLSAGYAVENDGVFEAAMVLRATLNSLDLPEGV